MDGAAGGARRRHCDLRDQRDRQLHRGLELGLRLPGALAAGRAGRGAGAAVGPDRVRSVPGAHPQAGRGS